MLKFDPLRSKPVRQQILLLGVVLTLANLAAIIHKSSRVFLFQQSLCLSYYLIHDPTKIDSRYRVEEALCKTDEIQSWLSMTDGIDSFLSCLPGMAIMGYLVPHLLLNFLMCSCQRKKQERKTFMTASYKIYVLIYAVAILALLVLATYKELLSFVGLRRLVIINLCCSALGVFCSILSCTQLIPISIQHLSFLQDAQSRYTKPGRLMLSSLHLSLTLLAAARQHWSWA